MHHFNILGAFYQARRVGLIHRFQIIQESEDLINVLVLPFKKFPEREVTSLQTDLYSIVGPGVHFKIKTVNEIIKNGTKRKLFISRLPPKISPAHPT